MTTFSSRNDFPAPSCAPSVERLFSLPCIAPGESLESQR